MARTAGTLSRRGAASLTRSSASVRGRLSFWRCRRGGSLRHSKWRDEPSICAAIYQRRRVKRRLCSRRRTENQQKCTG